MLEKWRTEVIFEYPKAPLYGAARSIYAQMLDVVRNSNRTLLNPAIAYTSDLIRHDRATLAQDTNPSGFWLVGETGTYVVLDASIKNDISYPSIIIGMINGYFTKMFRFSSGILREVNPKNSSEVMELINNS